MKNLRRMSAATLAAITAASCIAAVANAESEEYKLLVSPLSVDTFNGEVGITDTGFFSVTDEDITNWQNTGEFTYSELTADFEIPEIVDGLGQKGNVAWMAGRDSEEQDMSLRVLNYDPEAKSITTAVNHDTVWNYINQDGTVIAYAGNDEAGKFAVMVTSADGKNVVNSLEYKGEGGYFWNIANISDNPEYACAILWKTDAKKVRIGDSEDDYYTQYAFDVYAVTKDGNLETVASYTFENSNIYGYGNLNGGGDWISWMFEPMGKDWSQIIYSLDSKETIEFPAYLYSYGDDYSAIACKYKNGFGSARIDYVIDFYNDTFVGRFVTDYTTDPIQYSYMLFRNDNGTVDGASIFGWYSSSSDGKIFCVQKGDKWGYIDANGKELAMFDDAGSFEGDYAPVVKDGKAYLIDRSMNRVSEMIDADGVTSIEGNDRMFKLKKDGKTYLATFALPAPEDPVTSDTSDTSDDTSSTTSETSSDTSSDTSDTSDATTTSTPVSSGSSETSGKDNPPTGSAFGVMLTLTAIAGAVAVVSRKKR